LAHEPQPDWADLLAKEWMNALRDMYRNRGNDGSVYRPIVTKTARELVKPVDDYFGQNIDYDAPDYVMREVLKRNIWRFSVAKNYNDNARLNNLLLRKDGSLRPWNEFKREALKVVGLSNRYLKTEYDTIVAGAQMSRLWMDVQRDKAIFPFVQMDVVMDGHTSEICKPLDKVIFSVDDPVLAYYWPPNHFNCRTTVRRLRKGPATSQYQLPEIPEAFRNNVGVSGEIFTDENSYFKNTPQLLTKELDFYEEDGILISKVGKRLTKSAAEQKRIDKEFADKVSVAKTLKMFFSAKEVKVMPDIKIIDWSYLYHFEKAPIAGKVVDLKVGNIFWEMESYEGKFKLGKIGRMITNGQEQSPYVVLKLNHNVSVSALKKQVRNLLMNENFIWRIKEIVIINNNGEVILYKKNNSQ